MKILPTFRPNCISHLRPEEDLQAGTRELCILHTCFSQLRSPLFIRIMLPACLKHSVVQCGAVRSWRAYALTDSVEPLYKGHCWDPAGCPVQRGVPNSEVRTQICTQLYVIGTTGSVLIREWPLFHCSLIECLLQGLPLITLPLDEQYIFLFGGGSINCRSLVVQDNVVMAILIRS